MGLGMTNGPGKAGYYAKQAYDTAAAAMAAVEAAPTLVPATSSNNGYMTKEYAGKLDGIEAGANNYTHPDSGVTADTYQSVTVDAKGHVTAGTKSTTFMQTLNTQGTDAETVRSLIGADTIKLEEIEDMAAYMRELNKKASAPEVRKAIEAGYFRRARKTFTLADLSAAVASGDYNKYDILPGDYFTGASGYTYIFAGHNPLRGTYTGYPITADHAGLIVDTHETAKWNASTSNTTAGGYVGSNLHSYLVNTVLPKVKSDLGGVSHLYAHQKLYSTAVGTTLYNRFGSNTGASSSWAWSADQYIAALSEVQVYGGTVWSSSGYDTGEADQQLEVFKHFKHTEIFGNEYVWLRDVASAALACYAHYYGTAGSSGTSSAYYVAGLIAFH